MGAATVPEALQWARSGQSVAVPVRDEDAAVGPETADDIARAGGGPGGVLEGELAVVVYGLVLEGRETAAGRGPPPPDLFALADSVADSIGAAVIIEDGQSRLLGLFAPAGARRSGPGRRHHCTGGFRGHPRIRVPVEFSTHLAHSDEPMFGRGRGPPAG